MTQCTSSLDDTRAVARLTSKYQATVPRQVRRALGLGRGDVVLFEIRGGVVTLRKAAPLDLEYLKAVEGTLSEWLSDRDEDAWREL
ncbi:MAG: AbrB/MazE/SpoVT family DNA-binding domain-containing protein [Deltaproteobacteria bacterium]|nr:AbrB/MazE/SpoVT family DNA-binding domain-containing protein [Deltaproteobacteria bacterium]